MSYNAERRQDENARRRAEILDAAELLYIKKGWDALTIEQVARSARLSRALVYVYFRDKEDLLFAIGARAMLLLRKRCAAATVTGGSGMDQIVAIGRAYVGYAAEFPHYFDFCSRFQTQSIAADSSTNEGSCELASDQILAIVIDVLDRGIRDGSIRSDIGHTQLFAMQLWAFTHGVIQLATTKGGDLARHGVAIPGFYDNALGMMRRMAEAQ